MNLASRPNVIRVVSTAVFLHSTLTQATFPPQSSALDVALTKVTFFPTLWLKLITSHVLVSILLACFNRRITYIQGVTGGTDQTSGECSLGQTIPI